MTPNPKFVFQARLKLKIIFLTKPGNSHRKEVSIKVRASRVVPLGHLEERSKCRTAPETILNPCCRETTPEQKTADTTTRSIEIPIISAPGTLK